MKNQGCSTAKSAGAEANSGSVRLVTLSVKFQRWRLSGHCGPVFLVLTCICATRQTVLTAILLIEARRGPYDPYCIEPMGDRCVQTVI